jgi:radical SAM protein
MSSPGPSPLRYDRAPARVYWETTRACDLACRHCRATAAPDADPGELTSEAGRRLLDRLAAFGPPHPHVVLTGGDPFKRADLFPLIAHARGIGLGVSVSPSGTALLTPAAIHRLKDAGVEAISLSLDGPDATTHDALRGVPGTHARTVDAARAAAAVGLPVQVNTLVSEETLDGLPATLDVVRDLRVARWSLFFLVTVGRGAALRAITPGAGERLLNWLADRAEGCAREGGPVLTTTEAPHFRRVLSQRRRVDGPIGTAGGPGRGAGIRDGNGILFISHVGDIFPSGFLPIAAGHVRADDLVAVYREAALFTALRDPDRFEGRCGACEFRQVCGGSRARAFAATGRVLAEDPLCPYVPRRGPAAPPVPAPSPAG